MRDRYHIGRAVYRKKVKEADLYSAFIEVPYTQGAQVRITQCYLQTTPYLPLPRKHSPDGASQTDVADIVVANTAANLLCCIVIFLCVLHTGE